jgi:hypothetical protein
MYAVNMMRFFLGFVLLSVLFPVGGRAENAFSEKRALRSPEEYWGWCQLHERIRGLSGTLEGWLKVKNQSVDSSLRDLGTAQRGLLLARAALWEGASPEERERLKGLCGPWEEVLVEAEALRARVGERGILITDEEGRAYLEKWRKNYADSYQRVLESQRNRATIAEVRGLVLGTDGKPAAGRRVRVYGLSRGSLKTPSLDETQEPPDYITDAQGRFTAPFREGEGWDMSVEGRPVRYGQGIWVLVVEPGENDAGGISARLWNGAPGALDDGSEPRWGTSLRVAGGGFELPIQVIEGTTINGSVMDRDDPSKPLPGVTVSIGHDLEANTRTGVGGEVFERTAVTDERGEFKFSHVHRGRVFPRIAVRPDAPDSVPIYWLATNDGGPEILEALEDLEAQGPEMQLGILATYKEQFRYFGKVTGLGSDFDYSKVEARIKTARTPRADRWTYHGGDPVSVRADGTFEVLTGTPWAVFLAARMQDEGADISAEEGGPLLAPGEYNLVLKPTGN